MRFHLTYEGPLRGAGSARPDHKHAIRRALHRQLKRLWQVHPFLKASKHGVYQAAPHIDPNLLMWEGLAQRHVIGSYRCVPLVREELALICSLDILFLRSDGGGNIIKSADIDARLKTLFDALKQPREPGDLGTSQTPEEGEDPFFCLLEDDKLITHVSVETDVLLEPTSPQMTESEFVHDARLVIDVHIRPYSLTMGNIGFGS